VIASPLFTPFTLGPAPLRNRIVMAPMTRSASPDGIPGADVAAYYRRRAEHGVGLIVTEGTFIDHPAAAYNPSVPRFYGDEALAGWARVAREVHDAGGRIMPQLWHVGMVRKEGSLPYPEVPSVGAMMPAAEVASVIASYARGAAAALRLGFDGIELHGAHGYLIDQFFWAKTNQRSDRYGGSLVARTRFAAEVVAACRAAVGPDFPIVLRYSQWKLQDYTATLATTPGELEMFLAPLVDAGVDAFHCSTRRFWQPEFDQSGLNLAGWTKRLTGKPVITVGSVGLDNDFIAGLFQRERAGNAGIEQIVRMIEQGDVDLVAIGRALLVDPAWAAKVRDGRFGELMPYTPDALKTLS
jgi:2,4-dienoyl-CoA reductase-like NADH-dependent reductase (Old Yellow Enzyme family)